MNDNYTETDYLNWLEQIAAHWQLGTVQTVAPPKKGFNNRIFIMNDTYAIRFDGLSDIPESRFAAEKLAYDALGAIGAPVPHVIAVDRSRAIAPMDVMIMTKIEGDVVEDTWPTLTEVQQRQLSFQAGEVLARMHNITFPKGYGYVYQIETSPFPQWSDHVIDFADRYIARARSQRTVDAALITRMQAALARQRPLLDAISTPHLVHADAHWGNWLQKDGKITGLVDFEWARVGDPSSDFQVEYQWDEICPGSRAPLYEGYLSVRPLDAAHPLRAAIYRMLRNFDTMVECKDSPEDTQYQEFFDLSRENVVNALTVLEAVGR